ncbi:DUF58 domain-containing protein [Microbacteriaceae bacterium VKM Ac-2854]|nr:DUF58 domain-containing protein [Microbacteriaceae bacterium VKM Ac-2854]
MIGRLLRRSGAAITPLGRGAVGVGLLALLCCVVLGWSEFAPLLWAVAAMFVVAMLALAGTPRHAVRLVLPTPRVRVGDAARVDVVVRNRRQSPLARSTATVLLPGGEVRVELPALAARGRTVASIPLPTRRRGVYRVGPTVIGRRDPLGLLQRRSASTESVEQFVHPRTIPLPAVSAGFFADLEGFTSRELTARDIAFHSVREYARGDDVRMVHWRSTAKSGRVMVRQFEQSRRSSLLLLLDTRAGSYSAADGFELAVSAVASLAERARREGRSVLVAVTRRPSDTVASRVLGRGGTAGLLDDLARIALDPEVEPLDALARRMSHSARDAALVALVCGDSAGYPALAASADPYRARSDVIILRCDAGADPSYRGSLDPPVLSIGLLGDLARAIGRAGSR